MRKVLRAGCQNIDVHYQSSNIDVQIFTEAAMDVAGNRVEAGHVRDEVAERTQKRFQDFLEEWRDEGDDGPKYLKVLRFWF